MGDRGTRRAIGGNRSLDRRGHSRRRSHEHRGRLRGCRASQGRRCRRWSNRTVEISNWRLAGRALGARGFKGAKRAFGSRGIKDATST